MCIEQTITLVKLHLHIGFLVKHKTNRKERNFPQNKMYVVPTTIYQFRPRQNFRHCVICRMPQMKGLTKMIKNNAHYARCKYKMLQLLLML